MAKTKARDVSRETQAARELIAKNLREVMKAKGVNQKQLVIESGVPQPNLSAIMNAKQGVSTETLARLASALGVSQDVLNPSGAALRSGAPDRDEHRATGASPGKPESGGVMSGARSGGADRVVAALNDYFSRRGRGVTEEERDLITGWFKAKPPAIVTDELIEDILRDWRAHNERLARRFTPGGGDGS